MSRLDVAIVGAGPAGAWAARTLALAGARVAMFDPSHPREKPCGGGLTGRALRLIAGSGVVDRVPGVRIRAARFTSGDACEAAVVSLADDGDAPLLVADRRTFDLALVEAAVAAGAEWRQERVRDVSTSRSAAAVTTASGTSAAGFLIGSDGANSLVRRRLTAPFSRSQLSIATGFYAAGVTSSEVGVHCVADPPGYAWSFPRPGHAAIGICAQGDVASAARLRSIVRDWIRRDPRTLGARLQPYGWPIPSLAQGDFAREQPAGERWALAGDAAGLVDPLTREGIYFALRSGELIATALAGQDPGGTYTTALREEVHPELSWAAALKAGFFSSRFTDLLVEALQRSDKVRAVMADLVAGRQRYATLIPRLLGTFEVGLAWRLLRLQVRGMVS
jgi:geranylgeranyl reductase family protein